MTTSEQGLAVGSDIYFALTAHTRDLVTILERDGTIRYASPSFTTVLGYAPEELHATSAFAHIHPDDVGRVRAAFSAAAQTDDGSPVHVRCRYRHANGSWRTMATIGSSRLADPAIHGFIATSHDITEQTQAEQYLLEREAQYRSIFEATTDGLSIVDFDGRIVEVNPAYCAMYGYRYDELIGMDGLLLSHPDERYHLGQALQAIAHGESYHATAYGVRKNGTLFHVDAHGTIFTYKGTPHILGVVRDVTEQVEAESQARETEARYRRIFEATSNGVSILDFDGRIVEVNPAFCAMFGYQADELIGMHGSSLSHPDDQHYLAESLQFIVAGEPYHIPQARAVRRDGTVFYIEAHGSIFSYKGTPHAFSVVRDITERAQARELLEQRVAERTGELAALLAVSRNVASTLDLQPLLGLILEQLNTVVEYTGAGIVIQDGMEVRIIGYRGPDADGPSLGPIPVAPVGPFWQLLRRNDPVSIPDVYADTPEARLYRETVGDALDTSLRHIRSWMAVPMRVKDRDVGSLFLEHSVPHFYVEHHVRLALALAQQAAIAIENARLYELAQKAAILTERQRLARELHDSVSQALYGIGLGAQTAELQLTRDPTQLPATIRYLRELAGAGLAEMRALIFELLPEALEREGLVAALEKQRAAITARHGIAINAALCAEPVAPLIAKEAIYRIAQEALHNTVKHARARTVELRLDAHSDELVLEIHDDGAGFDPSGTFPGHLGLHTMRDRATRLGGTLYLESTPGHGTRISVRVPCRL